MLWVLGALFAVVNGVNDGATLVGGGLKIPAMRPITALLLLAVGLAAVPLVLGTQVATTLASRLVPLDHPDGAALLVAALVAAMAVVAVLSRQGLPTSLTLALIGGITGAGLGFGLAVQWRVVAFVLLLGVLAPLFGAAGGFLLSRLPIRLRHGAHMRGPLRILHRAAFGLQCIAYGANDGQKMLAVVAVAAGTAGAGGVEPRPGQLVFIAGCFVVGVLIGLPRIAATVSTGVLATRPADAIAAEWSSGAAVLVSGALGAPVSMTQSVAGALVGAGMRYSRLRVRWPVVARLVAAWVVTLPSAMVAAALAGFALRVVTGGGS